MDRFKFRLLASIGFLTVSVSLLTQAHGQVPFRPGLQPIGSQPRLQSQVPIRERSVDHSEFTRPLLSPEFAAWCRRHPPLIINPTMPRKIDPEPKHRMTELSVIPAILEDLNSSEQVVYHQMTKLLNDRGIVPDDRYLFFSGLGNPPEPLKSLGEFRIERWSGGIQKIVSSQDGAHLVFVGIRPVLWKRTPLFVTTSYTEVYYVVGNQVFFLNFIDPHNKAGQFPGMCTF